MSGKPDALSDLRHLLNEGNKLTLAEIGASIGKSERQVRRQLDELRKTGVRIKEEQDGRFKRFFKDDEDREIGTTVNLEERELQALSVAVQAARSQLAPTPLRVPLESAFVKLIEAIEDSVFSFEPQYLQTQFSFEMATQNKLDDEVFETVMNAVSDCRKLRIDYFSAHARKHYSNRLIDPYMIAARGTSWMLVAYCHETRSYVDFSLAGISRATQTDDFFVRDSRFDANQHFRNRFSALAGDGVHRVRLYVAPDKAPYFDRKTYHPTQQIERRTDDGEIIVTFEVSGFQEISSFIRSWGPGVQVLEPSILADRLASEAQQVAAMYAHSETEA